MEKISTYFTLEETFASARAKELGIDNSIPPQIMPAVRRTAICMDKVRKLLNRPVIPTCWYRCPALNKAVRGVPNSQHQDGEAVDFVSPEFGTPKKIAQILADNVDLIQFDQLIYEGTWIHISFSLKPRKQVLSKTTSGYVKGIV